MKKFYETPEFIKQQKEWYDLLADDGFQDIEQMDWVKKDFRERLLGNGCFSSAGEAIRAYSPDLQRFWELAHQFYWWLREHSDEKPEHIEMWRLYLDENSYAGVGRQFGVSTGTATKHIKRMERVMLNLKWREDDPDEEYLRLLPK